MANIFSVVALLIMFREALEASLIISVMLQLCDRLKLQPMKKVGALQLTDAYVGVNSQTFDRVPCAGCSLDRSADGMRPRLNYRNSVYHCVLRRTKLGF